MKSKTFKKPLLILGVLVLIAFAVVMAQTTTSVKTDDSPIKVTIATTKGFLGPPVNRYKVGEQIPVTITMTNTSHEPVYTCISSDVYQDVPKLTRDGKLVPYMNWQSYELLNTQRNHVCEEENLPEPMMLKANEAKPADWLVLVDDELSGADTWYDTLPAGKYELTLQRRLSCCGGPTVDSNTISFEVVQ